MLVLGERKSIIPVTYILIVLMAYYGPNANILGNIQLTIWHYQSPIVEIEDLVYNVGLLFLVDLSSFVVNGILLRYFCGINLMKTLKTLQQEFWLPFAIAEAKLLMEVFVIIDSLFLLIQKSSLSLSKVLLSNLSWSWSRPYLYIWMDSWKNQWNNALIFLHVNWLPFNFDS